MESKLAKYLPKKNQWMILLLVGILLVVIAMPTKKDTDSNLGSSQRAQSVDTASQEKRLENLLGGMKNVGKVQVMITYKKDESVQGIVILAEGGGNPVTVRNITEVVQALFAVDSHKIRVIESNQNK